MKKDTYYFSHDYNARNDRKLVKLRLKMKMEAIAVYWCLVEMLYEEGGNISLSEVPVMAAEWKVKEENILRVITDFELFESDGECFWSSSVDRRLEHRNEKSHKARESAKKRWGNASENSSQYEQNATGMRSHSDGNAIKESKVNESKGEEMKGGVGESPASPSIGGAKQDKLEVAKSFYEKTVKEAMANPKLDPDVTAAYRLLSRHLFGANPLKRVYRNVLSLPEQITFIQFQEIGQVSQETGNDPVKMFDDMEDWPELKKRKCVALTCIRWMRKNPKK